MLYGRILYELETGKEYVSRKDEALRQVKGRLAADAQRKERLRPVKRVAVVLAAMLVLVTGVEVFLHREWLFGKPSEDGQQYIIQGGSIDPGLVPEGRANRVGLYKEVRTEQLEDVVSVLGYKPMLPSKLPDGWRIQYYFASNTAETKRFTASYQNDNEEYLLQYEERTYSTAERARAELEQNELGASIIFNGTTVYLLENTTIPIGVWTKDLTYYSLYGPITKDEIIDIIMTVGG